MKLIFGRHAYFLALGHERGTLPNTVRLVLDMAQFSRSYTCRMFSRTAVARRQQNTQVAKTTGTREVKLEKW